MTNASDGGQDLLDMLVESNLQMASIVSGLLFACRSANIHNENVNTELDRTYEEINRYLEKVGKSIEKIQERRGRSERA